MLEKTSDKGSENDRIEQEQTYKIKNAVYFKHSLN